MDITDELLMAHADGELDDEALIERIERDPELLARVQMFRETRALFANMPADPVPDALEQRVRAMAAPNVVTLAPRRKVPLWQLPAAAAVALAVGLGAGLSLMPSPDGMGAQIAATLDTLPSGETATVGAQSLAAIATFLTPEGELCREYEQQADGRATVNVACRTDDGWDTRLVVATGGGDGYVPVSGIDALDAWLSAVEAGDPLEAPEESAALAER